MKSIVTGGAGFIGSHIIDALLELGHEVVVLDDLSTGLLSNLDHVKTEVEFVKGDIRDAELCERLVKGVDWVFHQGALGSVPRSIEAPMLTHEVNVTGTLNMLEAARKGGASRFVFAASSSAYGDTPTLPKIETMKPNPLSPYAASKLAAEHYLESYWHIYQLPTIGLRYFNIFGPRQRPDGPYAAVIPLFVDRIRRELPCQIHGDGGQTRDFTYVANAVQANIKAAQSSEPAFGKIFNVATGERISVNTLHAEIAKAVGKPNAVVEYVEPRVGDVRDSLADIELARTLLGYEPEVMLSEGLVKTIATFT
ncbi:MAG: SDR family oxidoreductase [Myxococcales bacterium]|nr:SDR family oxidoreductase [Myxococcales bacterium]